ncbi:MAG: hypothetical protein Q8L87_04935 [Anaerolineales bacterium]|nr:hypothetical protein [Anaerolineales bacterium]
MSEHPEKITVQDAVRLKHEINESIKYGGYNAREIEELGRLSEEQRTRLGAELANIKKVWWFLPDWVMVIGSIAAISSLFYFDSLTARVVSAFAAICCATQVTYRLGVYFGFARGYQEGQEQGVHRVLGISPDEAQDIDERATEMEMDEGLIKKFNERKG